jgi:hypothetical protein
VLRVKARGERDVITHVGHAAVISAGEFVRERFGFSAHGLECPRLPASFRSRTTRSYSCLSVVVFERVVVVPPSGSVTVALWLSELPATPSR